MRNIVVIILYVAAMGLIPSSFSQTPMDSMINDMRSTHDTLSKDIKNVISLVKSNHTIEAVYLLEGMGLKIDHMNIMFNDLVWDMSNRGH